MNERDFCYWLRGFIEIRDNNEGFTPEQVKMIEEHLNKVFECKGKSLKPRDPNTRLYC